jgi:hypothetical protein
LEFLLKLNPERMGKQVHWQKGIRAFWKAKKATFDVVL